MPSTPPVLIQALDYDGGVGYYVRSNGQQNDNGAKNYVRAWKVGGSIYSLGWDPSGDNIDGGSPYYYRQTWTMSRSTDNGATWAQLDNSNRPIGVLTGNRGGSSEAAVLVGTKIWLFFDYGEHPDTAGVYGFQFDEIRVISFDTATNTWGTPLTTGGPRRELTSVSYNWSNLATDAAYRGSDEIIVFHRDTDETQTYRRSLYSIFNINSNSWTTTNSVVFTSSNANIDPAHVLHDGTYTHFITYGGPYVSSTGEKWHRTLTGSTLGTVVNMYASWPGGWRALTADWQGYFGFPMVWGSEIIFVQDARLLTVSSTQQQRVIQMRAPIATAVPSWSVAEINSVDWQTPYPFYGATSTPLLVETGGDLYALYGGEVIASTGPTVRRYWMYAKKYLGSGSWGASVVLWDQLEALGYSNTGSDEHQLFKVSALGDLPGAALEEHIGLVASMEAPYVLDQDSTYWFRGSVGCCCYDFAY